MHIHSTIACTLSAARYYCVITDAYSDSLYAMSNNTKKRVIAVQH